MILASGAVLDFRPFYIVLTSNIGAAEAMRMQSAPFASVERTVLAKISQQLRPELVGRLSENWFSRGSHLKRSERSESGGFLKTGSTPWYRERRPSLLEIENGLSASIFEWPRQRLPTHALISRRSQAWQDEW